MFQGVPWVFQGCSSNVPEVFHQAETSQIPIRMKLGRQVADDVVEL